ncbi:MAG: LON peptidase substrate-binding domain-containing protein [Pseudomonadota bacterium]
MTAIAIFPIPNCVAFPGTVFPLHVFEPRYRQLVRYCLETETPLAVCHVTKLVRPGPEGQTRDEALNSNQATYKPVSIASAGRCELTEELEDGRMLVNVHVDRRYRLTSERQSLPFMVYEGECFEDRELNPDESAQALQLREKVLQRLLAITHDEPAAQELLSSSDWQDKPPSEFAFELFGLLQMNGDIMQRILEMESPIDRMQQALDLLNR